MSFKYSYNTIVYSGEDYLTQVKRLNKFGYDGIELVGEPSWYNFNEVNKLNEEYKINRVSGSIIQTIEEYNPVLEFTGKQGTIKKFGICTPVEDAPSNKF